MQMVRVWRHRSIGHCNENIKERERKRVGFKVIKVRVQRSGIATIKYHN